MDRIINGYKVYTVGGFITSKRWEIYQLDDTFIGTCFNFKKAKEACLKAEFTNIYKKRLY